MAMESASSPAPKMTQEQLEDVAKVWSEEDAEAFANRKQILAQMADLRAIGECLASWANECNTKWKEANAADEKRHAERLKWNQDNVGIASSYVPTMKKFNDNAKAGFDSLNEKPHWFDTFCASSGASRVAWDAIRAGDVSGVDLSTTGGVAVDGLFKMLEDAKSKWKPPVSATNSRPAPFNWSSHGYSGKERKMQLESKLEFGLPAMETSAGKLGAYSLPREYSNDIQCYIRTALNPPSAPAVAPSAKECCAEDEAASAAQATRATADRFSRLSVSGPSPSLAAKKGVGNSYFSATGSSGWWSGPHWSS